MTNRRRLTEGCGSTAAHRQGIAAIGRAAARGGGTVILTGEAGAGKSALVAHLLSAVDRRKLLVGAICAQAAAAYDPVAAAASAFRIDRDAGGSALAAGTLCQFLEQQARARRRCLLLVDDAHRLAPARLRILGAMADLTFERCSPLQLVLLGRPALERVVDQEPELAGLRRRVLVRTRLPALLDFYARAA